MPSYPTDNPDPSIYDIGYDDDQECSQCFGEGGWASCMEDCCPYEGGEEACDDPACWTRCDFCNPRKPTKDTEGLRQILGEALDKAGVK